MASHIVRVLEANNVDVSVRYDILVTLQQDIQLALDAIEKVRASPLAQTMIEAKPVIHACMVGITNTLLTTSRSGDASAVY